VYAVAVVLKLRPDVAAQFRPLMMANAQASLAQEQGCHRFDVCFDSADVQTVFLYELYADRAAFDAHLQTAHFKSFDVAVADMVADKTVMTFDEVHV